MERLKLQTSILQLTLYFVSHNKVYSFTRQSSNCSVRMVHIRVDWMMIVIVELSNTMTGDPVSTAESSVMTDNTRCHRSVSP